MESLDENQGKEKHIPSRFPLLIKGLQYHNRHGKYPTEIPSYLTVVGLVQPVFDGPPKVSELLQLRRVHRLRAVKPFVRVKPFGIVQTPLNNTPRGINTRVSNETILTFFSIPYIALGDNRDYLSCSGLFYFSYFVMALFSVKTKEFTRQSVATKKQRVTISPVFSGSKTVAEVFSLIALNVWPKRTNQLVPHCIHIALQLITLVRRFSQNTVLKSVSQYNYMFHSHHKYT